MGFKAAIRGGKRLGVLAAALAIAAGALLAACAEERPDDSELSEAAQTSATERGFDAVPPYIPQEYSVREDINWYLRETEGRHTWYVYALAFTGEPLFYIVSDMKPRNICVSLTAPDRMDRLGASTTVVRQAPALDGVYYSGGSCNAYYVRDVATGSFIELAGDTYTLISSKLPLFIETDRLRVDAEGAAEEQGESR